MSWFDEYKKKKCSFWLSSQKVAEKHTENESNQCFDKGKHSMRPKARGTQQHPYGTPMT